MELKLLSVFNWNIGFSTASHFKDFYMQVGGALCFQMKNFEICFDYCILQFALSDHDIHCGRPLSNREEALVYMEKNINYFLEVSLQGHLVTTLFFIFFGDVMSVFQTKHYI